MGKYNTVLEAIFDHAETMPDKVAVIGAAGKTTYGELAKGIRRAATILHDAGVEKGDRVLLSAPPQVEYFFAFFGAHLLGAIPSPIYNNGIEDIRDRINLLGAKGAFLENEAAKTLKALYFSKFSDRTAAEYKKPPDIDVNDDAAIIFTSATTGKPKGVLHTHKSLYFFSENIINTYPITQDTVWYIDNGITSIGRNTYAGFVFMAGGAVVLSEGFSSVKNLYTYIVEQKCNGMQLSAPIYQFLQKVTKGNVTKMYQGMRVIAFGGTATPPEILNNICKELPYTTILNSYGATEVGYISTLVCNIKNNKLNSVGKANPGFEVKIVDNNGKAIKSSADNPGTIAVRSPGVMKGYYNNIEQTKKAFTADGFLMMNDAGYIDEEGYIYLLGRTDDVINVDGRKVSPLAIEDAVLKSGHLAGCCCISVDDPLGIRGHVPVLYVVMKEGAVFSEQDLYKHLSLHLEKYKLPYKIICIDEIPVNDRGKYLRRELVNLWRESAK